MNPQAVIQALQKQRNDAFDAAAVAQAEAASLRARIADLEKQLAEKKPDPKPKK